MNYVLLGGKQRQSLMEDVLRETGCLAVSRVSCELELHGRLRGFELNSGVTRGRKLRSDGGGSKKDERKSGVFVLCIRRVLDYSARADGLV